MLRSDHVAIIDILRGTTRPTVAQMPRGYVQADAASWRTGYGYAFADGAFLGTVLGLKLTRLDSLADGHRDYYDDAGNLIYTT
jgi:hypothetical protein